MNKSTFFILHSSRMGSVAQEYLQEMNGSPLFTGDAGSGESDIRRYMIENDLVEGIVAMPTNLFYNTGISTDIWILTNNKAQWRKGKIQLVNAVDYYQKIVVERPLRLNFKADDERIERLYDQKAFQNLAKSKKKSEAGFTEEEAGQK